MPWKNDLAKLKQQLKEDPPAPPPPAVRKPVVAMGAGPSSIADEDALFLSAMGLKKPQPIAPSSVLQAESQPATPAVAVPVKAELDFASAMSDLKGLKPMGSKIPTAAPAPAKPASVPEPAIAPSPLLRAELQPVLPAAEVPVEAELDFASAMSGMKGLKPMGSKIPTAAPAPAPAASVVEATPEPLSPVILPAPAPEPVAAEFSESPTRIQLAAGMAIEVDGHLDLRGHSRSDAIERLRDRLEDARFMSWRSLHVTLGQVPELHEALLAFLEGPGPTLVHHYAQAPIPMGGAQAWILYLTA